jgi:uncharacterized protein (DUF1800 family)
MFSNDDEYNPDALRPYVSPEVIDSFRKVKAPDLGSAKITQGIRITKRKILNTGLAEYSGEWNKDTVLHLLRRTLFGVKKKELDEFSALSMQEAVSKVLVQSVFPAVPVNDYNSAEDGIADPHIAFGETWIEAPHGDSYEGQRVFSLKSWIIGNMINQESSITEKLMLFWHNLVVTESFEIFTGKLSYQYFKILRDNAFGNFKKIIKEITVDPAVLVYLNGNANIAASPDENYARELQELFCLGKGENSKYTEGDVQAAARVLTGWGLKWEQVINSGLAGSEFRPWAHDTSDKQFSSFYGDKVIKGKSGEEGSQEVDELLDMIFDNNELTLYICRRLYNFFVFGEIDAATETNVIVPLADIFRVNNYEILPVLEVLFKSEHFYDEANRGAMLKNPADHLVGTWRALEVKYDDPQDIYTIARTHLSMHWSMSGMGMELADPPSVAGWPAYYQAPQFDKSWITTDTITSRALRVDSMLFWGFYVTEELQIKADLIAFVSQFDNPELPGPMLEQAAQLLLGLPLSLEAINNIKAVLLTGQTADVYWTAAWNDYINAPSNDEFKLIIETRLKITFQSMLQLGEFQLM